MREGSRGHAEVSPHRPPIPDQLRPRVVLVIAPVVALVGLWDQPSSAPFILTATGLAATVLGPLLTSRYFAEPNYEVILSWDRDAVPNDWKAVRDRYFLLNWIRAALTWAAFALFVAAAYAHLT